jgi:hypothetical protein
MTSVLRIRSNSLLFLAIVALHIQFGLALKKVLMPLNQINGLA